MMSVFDRCTFVNHRSLQHAVPYIGIGICLTLSACGGGGSSTPNPPLTRLTAVSGVTANIDTSSKAKAVSATATSQAMNLDSVGNATSFSPAAGVVAATQISPASTWLAVLHESAKLAQQIASDNKVLAGITKTANCPGGGTATATSATGSTSIAAGTTVTFQMEQCAFIANSSTRFTGTITYIGRTGIFPYAGSEIVASMEPLKVDAGNGSTVTYDGASIMRIVSDDGISATLAAQPYNNASMTTEVQNNGKTYKETQSAYNWTYTLSNTQLTVYGRATVDSTQPALISALGTSAARYIWNVEPSEKLTVSLTGTTRNINSAGVIKITGANNTAVRAITGQSCANSSSSNCVKIETDANGDGIYEGSESMTWSDFSAKF